MLIQTALLKYSPSFTIVLLFNFPAPLPPKVTPTVRPVFSSLRRAEVILL